MPPKSNITTDIAEKKARLAELKAKRAAKEGSKPEGASQATSDPSKPSAAPKKDVGVSKVLVSVPKNYSLAHLSSKALDSVNIEPVSNVKTDFGAQCDLDAEIAATPPAELEAKLQAQRDALVEQDAKVQALIEKLKADKLRYDRLDEEQLLAAPKELSPQEQRAVEEDGLFQDFFNKTTRIVERALGDKFDPTKARAQEKLANKVVPKFVFEDKRFGYRAVTSMNFSPKFPELLCVSYAGHEDPMSNEPEGCVLIWNLHLTNKPEYQFYCNSEVLFATFHPSNPQLIIGSCRSGQVVVWDARGRSGPKTRTSLAFGHTYPIYALQCAPADAGAYDIFSVSTDGHACVWSDANLGGAPTSHVALTAALTANKEITNKEITATSFDFDGRDRGSAVLGTDEGIVFKVNLVDEHQKANESFKAHEAPITNVQFHPKKLDLFLTSSYDWTVKLWSHKTNRCLLSFESAKDYVFDARWSPNHPAVFAMGDGTGRLDVWNLNSATDVPAASIQILSTSKAGEKGAISRIVWSEDGKSIAVGMSTGSVHVLALDTTLVDPEPDAASTFLMSMQKLTTSVA